MNRNHSSFSPNNNNDDDDDEKKDKKLPPPPPEQSGYYILDVRETEYFLQGPWLSITPQVTITTTTDSNDDDDQDESANKKKKINLPRRCKTCHIPLSELKSRLFELPAKRTNLILVHDSDQDDDAVSGILGDGWNIVDAFRMLGARNTEVIRGHPGRQYVADAQWLCLPFRFEIEEFLKQEAKNANKPNFVPSLYRHRGLETTKGGSPLPCVYLPLSPDEIRGWSPSPFLEEHLDTLMSPQLRSSTNNASSSSTIAIDIGSGNGRDIAFLATRGIFDSIFAIDNRHHLLQNSLALAKRYSASAASSYHAVECTVTTSLPFREEIADLIICVRFLERPLLTSLTRYLKVGGFLLYSHFVDGVQHSAVGQPKNPKHFVLHGELKKKIVDEAVLPKSVEQKMRGDQEQDLSKLWKIQVMIDEEVFLEDGRPVNNLLIRRVC